MTPPFPDHPSGHGCVTRRDAQRVQDFFGTDKVAFDVVGGRSLDGLPIPTRHFDRFSDALEEVIDARVWGGIHFRTADEQGAKIGKKVAHWMRDALLRAACGTARERACVSAAVSPPGRTGTP